jgi:hypothetical protein
MRERMRYEGKEGRKWMRCGRWRKKRMKREIKTRKRKNKLSKFLEIVIHNLHWLYYYWIIKTEDGSYM